MEGQSQSAAELRSAAQPGAAVPTQGTEARSFLNIDTKSPVQIASDWEVHSHQDKELVKGLGLTSATMLVMGWMIGSGIFIVSSEDSWEAESSGAADCGLAGHGLSNTMSRATNRTSPRKAAASLSGPSVTSEELSISSATPLAAATWPRSATSPSLTSIIAVAPSSAASGPAS